MITFNKILDALNETLLFELAFERKDVKNKIRSMSDPINEHLFKLFCFPKNIITYPLKGEILSFIGKINS